MLEGGIGTSGRLHGTRALLVVRNLDGGGAERQATLLANYLVERTDATVGLLSLSDGERLRRDLDRRVAIEVVDPEGGGGRPSRLIGLARFVTAVRRWRPTVLLPYTDYPNKLCGALWRLTGAEGCVWNQRDEGREVTGRPLERLAVRWSTRFVANSPAGSAFLTSTFGVPADAIEIIPNSVVLRPPCRSVAWWRREQRLESDTVVVTMVANLRHVKDHLTLLEAWRTVVDQAPMPPVLLLAGAPGETAPSLRDRASRLGIAAHVRFLGHVEDVSGLLAASALSAFSSKLEGCPNGVLEPMAAGLPVVATDVVGIRQALGDDCDFLVPPDDPSALARGLLELISDPELRSREGSRNRRRAESVFPMENLERYVDLIERITGRSTGTATETVRRPPRS